MIPLYYAMSVQYISLAKQPLVQYACICIIYRERACSMRAYDRLTPSFCRQNSVVRDVSRRRAKVMANMHIEYAYVALSYAEIDDVSRPKKSCQRRGIAFCVFIWLDDSQSHNSPFNFQLQPCLPLPVTLPPVFLGKLPQAL